MAKSEATWPGIFYHKIGRLFNMLGQEEGEKGRWQAGEVAVSVVLKQ